MPYAGTNVYAMLKAKTGEDPQPPTRFRPDLDPHLEEIILHAIARAPRDRYQTAAEMLKDLQDPSQAEMRNRAQALHPTSLKWRRARKAIGIGVFFVSLIAMFLFLIWLANRYPAPAGKPRRSYRGEVR
jgi:ferric-dicitrate binding protein FerR (iron transport regulator)